MDLARIAGSAVLKVAVRTDRKMTMLESSRSVQRVHSNWHKGNDLLDFLAAEAAFQSAAKPSAPRRSAVCARHCGNATACRKWRFGSGISRPSPVQRAAIPAALTGQDLVGVAATGSGKSLGSFESRHEATATCWLPLIFFEDPGILAAAAPSYPLCGDSNRCIWSRTPSDPCHSPYVWKLPWPWTYVRLL